MPAAVFAFCNGLCNDRGYIMNFVRDIYELYGEFYELCGEFYKLYVGLAKLLDFLYT